MLWALKRVGWGLLFFFGPMFVLLFMSCILVAELFGYVRYVGGGNYDLHTEPKERKAQEYYRAMMAG